MIASYVYFFEIQSGPEESISVEVYVLDFLEDYSQDLIPHMDAGLWVMS